MKINSDLNLNTQASEEAAAGPVHGVLGTARKFVPLDQETRELLPTDCAAYHLNRRPQTLREWACLQTGLLRPIRIGNRLGWKTEEVRRLVAGVAK